MWKTFNNGGQNGAYWAEGEGKAVILIHGYGEDQSVWEHQTAFLRVHYRVLVPDLPGTGQSAITHPLSMESMGEFIYGMMTAEGISQATVIGHSMGGYVALAFAEKYPHLLEGLGLFSSTAKPDTEEKKEGRRKSIRMLKQYGVEQFLRQLLPNMFAPTFRINQGARVDNFIQQAIKIPQETLIAYYEAMMERPDRTAVLKEIKVPVLFFIGKEDQAVPLDNILSQVTMPAVASIHIIDQVGHTGHLEVYEESNLILYQFVEFCQRAV
ncbi:alpha/beta fold hydrolase [Chitinophaga sp. GCM10012297]|uniref:Alpha/beta hydrolase n=1 Tax=Chitinophaga chungangae TaxID=2821488 RepID=A0ABS3Y7K7_9BACT|nr:alpha/beta hydrolase [Chitinophaga chungangae]MBO9150650.1 alpha/beta hydrolase [Chitinophaga chungangae]